MPAHGTLAIELLRQNRSLDGQVTKTAKEDLKRTAEELDVVKGQLNALKATLYAKFGSQINLDE